MNLFELYAKIALDTSDYESGIENASGKTSGLADKLRSGLGAAAKAGAAALAATTTAVAALGKASIEGYAEYEQLTGGVETLFKTSADVVMGYAENAYKTAGLTANQYMETVTSFSASLLQGLGGDTEAAAQYADMAITDMADNANKMGTSMEMIQNAYQGFAKQNYTMLDNLKLGYGGTQEEMARLINDSGVLGDAITVTANTVKDVPFDQVIEAIHVIQTEIGITGTTAKEASSTIQGSIASMGSAWNNLVVGLSDGTQDLDTLINNFVESVGTAAENILPRVEQVLSGIGQLVTKLAPIIAEEVPKLITNVLPSFLDAGVQLLDGLIEGITSALPALVESAVPILLTLVEGIVEQLPAIIEAGIQVITSLIEGIAQALPGLIPIAVEAIVTIVQGLLDNLPMLLDAALQLITGLAEGLIAALPVLIAALPEIITAIVTFFLEAIPQIIEAGIKLLTALVEALPEIIAAIVEAIPQIIDGILTALLESIPLIVQAGIDLLVALVQALPEIITTIVAAIPQIITGIVDALIGNIDKIIVAGVELFIALIANLPVIIVEIVKAVPQIITGIVQAFASMAPQITDIGTNIISGIKDGILGAWDSLVSWFNGLIDGLFSEKSVDVAVNKTETGTSQGGFATASVNTSNSGAGSMRGGSTGGGDTYNFYSPKALDPVSAAREMKKAKQQMALSY